MGQPSSNSPANFYHVTVSRPSKSTEVIFITRDVLSEINIKLSLLYYILSEFLKYHPGQPGQLGLTLPEFFSILFDSSTLRHDEYGVLRDIFVLTNCDEKEYDEFYGGRAHVNCETLKW